MGGFIMADVYGFVIGKTVDGVWQLWSGIALVDGPSHSDPWYSDPALGRSIIGEGSGRWIRSVWNSRIELFDNSGGKRIGFLKADHWPLKQGDRGIVELESPIKDRGRDSRNCEYLVSYTE